MARIRLQLLGEFAVESLDGGRIGPLPRKARSLLACLAVDHPTALSRRRLSGLLWPDLDEMAARTNLRQALAAIRRELGDVLDADKVTVALCPHVFQIDVVEFEALAGSSSTEDQERAIGLYRGVLLEGFEADVPGLDHALASARERLHQMFMVLGTRALTSREASGQMDAAVLLAMQLVASDPLREDAHRALMRLLARQGRATAAMKQYQTCRELLRRELGVSPDPQTEALHRELLESRRRSTRAHAPEPLHAVDPGFERGSGEPGLHRPGESVADPRDASALSQGDAEVQQVTVMSWEIMGSEELSTRFDAEDWRAVVRAYDQVIVACVSRYEGIVHQRRSDGALAFFGVPSAYEGGGQRAIGAGLEILGAIADLSSREFGGLEPLPVRIGIAMGPVGMSASDTEVGGAAVSVAVRLQGLARPNAIVVSEAVQRLARGAVEFSDLGDWALPGGEAPVRAYEVSGLSAAAGRLGAATRGQLKPLVGRERELEFLLDRWSMTQDGEGQVVLVGGEVGIGKSRVLMTVRERLESHGAVSLNFQSSPYRVNDALWPIISNFEQALNFGANESVEGKLDRIEALVVNRYGRPHADVRFLASLLSIPWEARYGTLSMTPQEFQDETLRTWVDLTEAAARQGPSVMLFEDVHWADPTTQAALDLLVDRVRAMPLLVVLTHRPEFRSRWSAHRHVSALSLPKLTREQCRRMACIVADGCGLSEDALNAVVEESRGVPRRLEKLAKSIVESDEAGRVEDRVGATVPQKALAGTERIRQPEDAREWASGERDMDSTSAGRNAVEKTPEPARAQDSVVTGLGAVVSTAQKMLWLPFKPSIAVLPFHNMSGDPDQEFVADGLAEDLITALSRIHWLFVSARNSSFSFKGAAASVGEVARVLGVRYVVEGSVRKAGNRIRVTAQLVDAETGNHVWATRYDREMMDIFAIQDEISEAFVAAIEPEIGQIERERARRKPPDSLDCWEHYQRGLWHLYKFTAPDNAEAKRLLQHAVKLDPGFGPAHAGLGYAYFLDTIMGFGSSDRSIQDSYRSVRQAIALDDRDGHAHYTLGRIYMLLGDPEQAYAQSQRAVELNPSLAVAHFGLGHALMLIGQAEEAVAEFDAAIRLSPRDPVLWAFECTKSHALILLRRYDEAVNWARRSTRHPTAGVWAYIALACALGHADDQQHARIALAELLKIKPDCTLKFIMNYLPFVRASDFEHYAAGLIKAGFSEART